MSNKILNSLVILLITNVFIINNSYACTVNNLTQVTGPFGSINTALANASTGPQLDTIEFSGICQETVKITFPVILQGNGGILRAPAPGRINNAIEISSAGVTIQGATAISDLKIISSRYGILITSNGDAFIQKLIVHKSFGDGIHIRDGGNAIIRGVLVQDSAPAATPPPINIIQGTFDDHASGIVVTRNGVAAILNSTIRNNADRGIHVLDHGFAEISNVTVTGNAMGIEVDTNGGLYLTNSNINNNAEFGIDLFVSDDVIIGDQDGAPGDVLIQNNGQGLNVIVSQLELANTTISDNGGNSALNMWSSTAGLFGGNAITHDGTSSDACVVGVYGSGSFLIGGFEGTSDSITLVNEDANDTALCLGNYTDFNHSNISISGGSLGQGISAVGHSEINLNSINVSVTGGVNIFGIVIASFYDVTVTGGITAIGASEIGLYGVSSLTGDVNLSETSRIWLRDSASITGSIFMVQKSIAAIDGASTVSGVVECANYAEANGGGTVTGGYIDSTHVGSLGLSGTCGPP